MLNDLNEALALLQEVIEHNDAVLEHDAHYALMDKQVAAIESLLQRCSSNTLSGLLSPLG